MSLPSSLTSSIDKARYRVDVLQASLDRLSVEAEDLSAHRNRFVADTEELLSRVARTEENDLAARALILEEYQALAGRLQEHCHHLIQAGQSCRKSLLHSSAAAEADSALERSSSLFISAASVKQSLRRMREGPACGNTLRKA